MKLTILLFIVGLMQVSATVYSQATKFNFEAENKQIVEVLKEIEETSNFRFFYIREQVDVERKVSVKVRNATVEEILDELFEKEGINYRVMEDNLVLLSPENISPADEKMLLQQKSVSGKVADETGQPLPGVTVIIKGTTNGTVTNADGSYSLTNLPSDATLVFSFVGMLTQEIVVGNQSSINVTLAMDAIGIEEVVAIGYGTQKRRDITGSVSSVKGDVLNEIPSSSVEQTLIGRASGVQVTQGSGIPGAGASIRVRGVGTVNNAEPLYVIDGIIMGNISGGGQTSVSPLSMLNPNDIESIDILKDASATAIYGARAGNGVVIVTTKKGTVGTTNITFSTYSGANVLQQDKIKMLTGTEWAGYYNNLRVISNEVDYPGKEFVESINNGTAYDTYDWRDYAIRTGTVNNYDLSVNSGSEKSQMYASLNYFDQKGIMINSDLKRYTARINSDHKISDKLTFGEVFTVSRTSSNTVGNLDANNNTRDWLKRLLWANPYKRPYAEDGDYAGTSDFYVPQLDHDNEHALWDLEQRYSRKDITRLWGSVYAGWEIIDGLNFKSTVSIDWSTSKNENRVPNQLIEGNATTDTENNSLSFSQSDNQTWFIENTLTYTKTFLDDHKLTVLGGYQAQQGLYRGFSAGNGYFVDTDYWFFSRPQLTSEITDSEGNVITTIPRKFASVGNYQSESAVVSYFGRLLYSFQDKYLLTATVRHDGSSRFGANKRWGTFPAVNVGWRITEEEFMQDMGNISNLKLRAGYGVSGSDNVPNYQYQSIVGGGSDHNYVFNEGIVEGYNLTRLANPNLQWETIKMTNIGVDAGFLNNRLELTVDVYKKNTQNLFLSFAPPVEVGLESNPNGNLGEVQNTGLEIDLSGNILTGELTWNANLNFSTVKNEVIALAADGADRYNGANITRVGEEIGALYGYVMDGLFQNWDEVYDHAYQRQATTGEADENGIPILDPTKRDDLTTLNFTSPGDIRFKDLNGDGVVDGDKDRAIIGSTIPDFIWGFNNDFSYKGIGLSIFFQGVQGVDIYNSLKVNQETTSASWENRRATVLDAWSGEGTSNTHQRSITSDPNTNSRTSSRYIEDGSFVRLKNVRLSYNLPKRWISQVGMKNAQIYVNGTNLLTITKYSGYDPEVGLRNGGNPETAGVDAGVYPVTRQFTAGVKVTF